MAEGLVQSIIEFSEGILGWFLPDLTIIQWTGHLAILAWSISMIALSGRMFAMLEVTSSTATKVKIFRTLNVLVIALLLFDLVLLRLHRDYEQLFSNIGLSILTIYSMIYLYSLASFQVFKRFGTQKTIDSKEVFVETYSTRIVNLVLVTSTYFSVFYIIIKIWGADSLLETTGLIGIFVGFMAFTSPVWAPDIIAGLTILNSQILDDGDVVVIDGFPNEYIISKVSFFYVTLYDVRNNHRSLIKNSQFLAGKIDNLSRLASTEGMRTVITYNIGYPKFAGHDGKERLTAMQEFMKKVDAMFYRAFETCCNEDDTKINPNKPFEWALTKTGDYSLEFSLWFYFAKVPNTKITATARKHLMGTLYRVNRAVYESSVFYDIDLSTPDLTMISLSQAGTKGSNDLGTSGIEELTRQRESEA